MIQEEYDFVDISDYLYANNDLLIGGFYGQEERSVFLFNIWNSKNKPILLLNRSDGDIVEFLYYDKQSIMSNGQIDLSLGTPRLFKDLGVYNKNILIDLSSLDHVLIMFLTKILVNQIVPRSLFAAYIRPQHYCRQSGNIGFSLCDKVLGVKSVPGFIKRESEPQTLCSFMGFEWVRLKGVIESVYNIEKIIPVVAFPTGSPQWYNVAMWNSMDILQSGIGEFTIHKCFSESVFQAVSLLRSILNDDDKIVLAPLGTRPHSMACAIFACHHLNTRIIYDYVIENENRAVGVAQIKIYHLSSFLKT